MQGATCDDQEGCVASSPSPLVAVHAGARCVQPRAAHTNLAPTVAGAHVMRPVAIESGFSTDGASAMGMLASCAADCAVMHQSGYGPALCGALTQSASGSSSSMRPHVRLPSNIAGFTSHFGAEDFSVHSVASQSAYPYGDVRCFGVAPSEQSLCRPQISPQTSVPTAAVDTSRPPIVAAFMQKKADQKRRLNDYGGRQGYDGQNAPMRPVPLSSPRPAASTGTFQVPDGTIPRMANSSFTGPFRSQTLPVLSPMPQATTGVPCARSGNAGGEALTSLPHARVPVGGHHYGYGVGGGPSLMSPTPNPADPLSSNVITPSPGSGGTNSQSCRWVGSGSMWSGSSTNSIQPAAKPKRLRVEDSPAVRSSFTVAQQRIDDQQRAYACGIPVGPLLGGVANWDDCALDLKRSAADVNTPMSSEGCGGFTIRKNGGDQSSKEGALNPHGPLKKVECCGEDSNGHKCPWMAKYEKTFDGFVLFSCHETHNHELEVSQVVIATTAAGRQIPAAYYSLGELLVKSGISCQGTLRVLNTKADMDGIPHLWLYEDVYNRFYRDSVHFNTEGFLKELRDRKDTTGLDFCLDKADDNSLLRVFVEMPKGRQLWASCSNASFAVSHNAGHRTDRVLFIDPTCNTNKYGLKLTMFVTIDSDGHTRVVGYLLHFEESHEDIFWSLRCFETIFEFPPSVVLTDSGTGLLSAINAFMRTDMPWQNAVHLLCIFHLDINFQKHIKPLFRGNEEDWKTVHNGFWRLAKDSDSQDEILNPTQMFADLRDSISGKGSGATKDSALEWYDDTLVAHAGQWVGKWAWKYFTGGARSTGRSESTNSAFKKWSKAKSSLVELHHQLSNFDQQTEFKAAVEHERKCMKQRQTITALPPWMQGVSQILTPYAITLLLGQLNMSMTYASHYIEEGVYSDAAKGAPPGTTWWVKGTSRTRTVLASTKSNGMVIYDCDFDKGTADSVTQRWTTHTSCSCQYDICWGIPCRHILHLWMQRHCPSKIMFYQLFNTHWINVNPEQFYDYQRKLGSMADQAPASYEATVPLQMLPGTEKVSTCYRHLIASMDKHSYKPAYECFFAGDESVFDIGFYIDTTITFKYGTAKWYLAVVRTATNEQIQQGYNCQIHFWLEKDNATIAAHLTASYMVSNFDPNNESQVHRQYSWMPVKPTELHLTQAEMNEVTSPNKKPTKKGRGQEKRFKPLFGPTSDEYRKARKDNS